MDKNIQTMAGHWLLMFSLILLNTQVHGDSLVKITLLDSAVAKGAVCLDGSPPAYSYAEGFGDGARNWIVYLEGGAWCNSTSDCLERSKQALGSSHMMGNQILFSGLLDTNSKFNPDFYNWHKVYIFYCDGSSFMSDVAEIDPVTNLTFRGARIFNAMMEELLAKGMGKAQNAILTGSSAGGLSTILHCDKFRALLPNTSRVKCISDSGFFIHGKDQPGVELREQRFANVVKTHKIANSLPRSCTSKMDPSLCLFPENLVGDIQTPLFILESAFDKYQIEDNLLPAIGGKAKWSGCLTNLTLCDSTQLGIMKNFRIAFIKTLEKLNNSSTRGMFVHSCYLHGHILGRDEWMCSSVVGNNVLANKTIGRAIGDWYFDRSSFRQIDTQNELPRNCTKSFDWRLLNQKCLATMYPNA